MHKSRPCGLFVGLATLDVFNRVERFPRANEKVTAYEQTIATGGPASNAAVVFSALGGEACLLTALGQGPIARIIHEELAEQGVRVIDAASTGCSAAPVSSISISNATGERSVVSIDGSAIDVAPFQNVANLLMKADIVLVDGHYPRLAMGAARAAAHARKKIMVDAGRWKPVFEEILPLAEAVICSDDFRTPGARNSRSSALQLRKRGIPIVVTTHGADPIQWWQGSQSGSLKVPTVHAVDTLGAGDAFHGSYAYFACKENMLLTDRLKISAEIASLRCSMAGPRTWLGELPKLLDKLKSNQNIEGKYHP